MQYLCVDVCDLATLWAQFIFDTFFTLFSECHSVEISTKAESIVHTITINGKWVNWTLNIKWYWLAFAYMQGSRCIEEHFHMHKIIDNLLNYYLVLSFSSILPFYFSCAHLTIGKGKDILCGKWFDIRIVLVNICTMSLSKCMLFFGCCSIENSGRVLLQFFSNIFGRTLKTASAIVYYLIYIMCIFLLIWWMYICMCMCAHFTHCRNASSILQMLSKCSIRIFNGYYYCWHSAKCFWRMLLWE